MKAFQVSKKCKDPVEEKIDRIKKYEMKDLFYVLREVEKHPEDYDAIIVAGVAGRLYDMGIIVVN